MEPYVGDHQVLHSHYWLSGMVARTLRTRHRIPMVHTMHTMARVKNELRGDGHATEPDVRERGEAEIVAAADILTANTSDEAAELQRHYGARPEQIAVVPPGVDLHTFHPCDQPKSRAQLGVAQDAEVILFVGRIQPLKAPDVLIKATARLVAERPERRQRLRLIIIGSPSGPEAAWAKTLPGVGPGPRDRRRGGVPATLPPGGAVPLVLRLRRRRGAVAQRVVRPGRPGGPGLRSTGGGHRRRWSAARGRRRCHRSAGARSRPGRVGRRSRLDPGRPGGLPVARRDRGGPRGHLQLVQHGRLDAAGVRRGPAGVRTPHA